MITELANTINSQDESIEKLTYQRTLFPAPATKGDLLVSTKAYKLATTDVFHESIEENLVQTISISSRYYLERTKPRSLCGAIYRQRCNLSIDLVERANVEQAIEIYPLPDNLSESCQESQRKEITDVLICSRCSRCRA